MCIRDRAAPAFSGAGIGDGEAGLAGVDAICDFAAETAEGFSITLGMVNPIAPTSGRDDVAAWLAAAAEKPDDVAPLLEQLPPMLQGTGRRGMACLSDGGFSMDDAAVLVELSAIARARGTDGWPTATLKYLQEGPCRDAGLLP